MNIILVILLVSFSAGITANDMVISDGNIIISDGIIRCKDLICNRNAFKCRVERKTINNNAEIETTMQCFDGNGTVTNERRSAVRNPDPSQSQHSVSEANANGYIQTSDAPLTTAGSKCILFSLLGGVMSLYILSFHA